MIVCLVLSFKAGAQLNLSIRTIGFQMHTAVTEVGQGRVLILPRDGAPDGCILLSKQVINLILNCAE